MRVTNSMMISSFLRNMNTNLSKVSKYSDQVSTGQKMIRLSDDPIGVLNSMNARQKLLRFEQYNENLTAAKNFVDQAESSMSEMNDTLTSIYEKVVEASSDTNSDERKTIAGEVKALVDHMMQTANTAVGSQYIFGGFNTTEPPFTRDSSGKALYNGLDLSDSSAANVAKINAEESQSIRFEVGFSNKMEVSANGVELMGTGDDSLLNLLDSIVSELENGASAETLTARISDVQKAQSIMLTNTVSMGAKMTKIELLENRYAKDIINYTEIKSSIEDVDQVEALMQLKMSEAIYNQALSAGAQIIQPSLLDYLR